MELQAPRVPSDRLVLRVREEREDPRVILDPREHPEKLDLLAPRDGVGRLVEMEDLEVREPQVITASLVIKGLKEFKAFQVCWDFLVFLGQLENLAVMETEDHQDLQVNLVRQGKKVFLAFLELQGHRGQEETVDQQES